MADEVRAPEGAATARSGLADTLLAVALLALSGVMWVEAAKLRTMDYEPLGPAFFPKLISIGLGLAGLALIARTWLRPGAGSRQAAPSPAFQGGVPALDGPPHERRPALAALSVLVTVAYVAALSVPGIGFLWGTMVFLAVLGVLLAGRSRREIVVVLCIAVLGAPLLRLLFTRLVYVDLP